jgi:glycosyltransferase involved in cell wall biosynthesis
MKIIIATGIYPPRIGGPSFYAKALKEAFEKKGHVVSVVTYGFEHYLPTGIRHAFFFCKLLFSARGSDAVIALDTFSVGVPAAWLKSLTSVPFIIRTGGDFLWETYVERTGQKIVLSNFYTQKRALSIKEKIIFQFTRFVLSTVDRIVFSTTYQRDIWLEPYGVSRNKTHLIENYYGPKSHFHEVPEKIFIGYTRELVWKNIDTLERAFMHIKKEYPAVELKTGSVSREQFLRDLEKCYAVVLVSLGDISPNMVLEALQFGKPVLLTKENGLTDRLGDTVLYADPLNEKDIQEKIELLLQPAQYAKYKERAERFNFVHKYETIAEEFLAVIQEIQ